MSEDNIDTWLGRLYIPAKDKDIIDDSLWDVEVGGEIQYIRSDLANERQARLLEALKDALRTIENFAPHADEYLKEELGLKEEFAKFDKIIAEFEALK